MSEKIEVKDESDDAKLAESWLREIRMAGSHEEKWRKRARKVLERYRDEEASEEETRTSKFNILFANTEVLRGVIYQKTPVPDVRRRFLEKDQTGREAATILQRALAFCIDSYDFDGVMSGIVEDYLLPGRGLGRVKYVPTFGPVMDQAGQPVLDEAGQPQQQVVYEVVESDYVEWDMVRISPAKRWKKVRWVAFGELLTRDELVKQFGEQIGRACKLDWAPKDKEKDDDIFKRALVWTIWDKPSKKVYVVSAGLPDKPLKVLDDPLKLKDFFPCPEPIYAIKNTGTMVPIPEYCQYQDQAIELDNLTARIEALTDALRRRGVYNGNYPELQKLANASDNEFIAVEKFSEMVEKGGIDKAMWEAPIDGIAAVILKLMEQREAVKQIIYEVTGLADVVRGVSHASETLGAQQLKARYANSRTGPRQKSVQNMARDLLRLKAEIIAEKFSPQTLAQMTGVDLAMNDQEKAAIQTQLQAAQAAGQKVKPPAKLTKPTWEQIMQVLRSDQLRGFRIDIETDSTVQPDAVEEQKNRVELLGAITSFVTGIGPAVQSGAVPMETAKELLSFGVRGFKVSPQLEDMLDSIGDSDKEEQAPAAPDLDMIQAQQQIQDAQQAIAAEKQQLEKDKISHQIDKITLQAERKIADAQQRAKDASAALEGERERIRMAVERVLESQQLRVDAILSKAAEPAEREAEGAGDAEESDKSQQVVAAVVASQQEMLQQIAELIAAPRVKVPTYGPDGRIAAVEDRMA